MQKKKKTVKKVAKRTTAKGTLKRRTKQIGTGGAVISPYAKKLVNQVLDSGRISYGPFLKKLEQELAQLHDRKYAITTISGTNALLVALQALREQGNWQDGDEVIVPATTFIATSNVVLQNGLVPVFVDVDPVTCNIDPTKIEEKITPRTRAIMPVHLFGLSAEMREIMQIARKHKLKVLEDSCEALGVSYRGKPIASMGDVACFSFYMQHLITTGVGGLVLTNDKDLADRVRSLVNHGRDPSYTNMDADKGKRGEELKDIIERRFSFISVGHSHRITEMEGALGVAQVRELKQNIRHRQRLADAFIKGLSRYAEHLQLPTWPEYAEHAFMMFPIIIRQGSKVSRDDLVAHLEEWNIETRPIFPLLSQPVYIARFGDIEHDYPIARYAIKNGFYIGSHPEMTRDDVGYILSVFEKFFENFHA